MPNDNIDLEDMIVDLRAQLERAAQKRPEAGLQFELGEIELELKVQIAQSQNKKFSFNVIGLQWDKSKKDTESNIHTFKLKLKPYHVDQDGNRTTGLVSRQIDDRE